MVAVAPLLMVPKASGAVAVAEIGVTIVAVEVTDADCAKSVEAETSERVTSERMPYFMMILQIRLLLLLHDCCSGKGDEENHATAGNVEIREK
jgi:hypothetical protein